MPNWTGSWAGGRTYQTKDNRTVWVIRKMVKGHRYQMVPAKPEVHPHATQQVS